MKSFFRLVVILWVITKYRLDTLIPQEHLPLGLKVLFWISPWRLLFSTRQNPGERIRLALESLGPVFVKFGQMLSTRQDLLPEEMARELAKLQDQVPPFEGKLAQTIIEKSLAAPIDQLFDNFDLTPLASASVAQVHGAHLKTGQEVVIKVIRPGIEVTIGRDLALMFTLAKLVETIPEGQRLRPVEVVDEYRKTITDELDLMREAANGATLRRNFENSNRLHIPTVYWDFTRKQVLTMERIHGISVSDIPALEAQNTNMKVLAERGVEIFFTQVFRDNFFHADMHPGNVFVSREHPESPTYIGIDCGIVGSLSENDLNYLAQILLAFFERDYHGVAAAFIEAGWVPKHTQVHEFEGAIRSVCEPVFEKPLAEISFGLVLVRLFQVARRFEMQVQPQLVLLQKTLLNIEGLGRQIYPQLDLWQTAKPFLKDWIKERLNPLNTAKTLWRHLPLWLEKAPQIPDMAFAFLDQSQHLNQSQQQLNAQIEEVKGQIQRQSRQRRWQWLANLSFIGTAWFYLDLGHHQPFFAISCGAFGIFALIMSFRR